ncbi:MAG: hypothetical protein K2G77_09140, partial [Muribaculaceae bacterium]|nr:hypothetical protein [Muribaculaceae bacterium]
MNSIKIRNKATKKVITLLSKGVVYIVLLYLFSIHAYCDDRTIPYVEVDTSVFLREARELQELLVTPGKEKYSSKDNPAVELVRSIRNNQKKGDPKYKEHYSYDRYDKIVFGLLDINENDLNKHEELKAYLDTASYGRRQMLKVLLNERASTILYTGKGKHMKTVGRGDSSYGISEMFDTGNVEVVFDELLKEIDIYDNYVSI